MLFSASNFAMKDRGKAVVFDFSSASETRCRRHPYSSSVGICPFCLKEKLLKLLVEENSHRHSSFPSPDVSSSYRHSCSTVELGTFDIIREDDEKSTQGDCLSRSNSERRSLWRLFGKKSEKNEEAFDVKSENLGCDKMDISRSRSVRSFKGGDDGSEFSDVTYEIDGITKRGSAFPYKESHLGILDESDFIDLKLDFSAADPKKESSSTTFSRIQVKEKDLKRNRRSRKVWRWIFKKQQS